MQQDIWRFSALLIISGVVGYSLGHSLLVMLCTALGIIAWQIFRLGLLHKWMLKPGKFPMPDTSGQMHLIHREANRRRVQNRKRKKQLTSILSQFRSAIAALPDAIVLIDDHGKIEWASPNAETVLGIRWPEDSAVGFGDLIRYPSVIKLLNTREPSTEGVVVNSITNESQVINIKFVRYTENLRMVIARDVSRLVKVNKMQSDFVANVSHELKTPLTVLRGYVEIMEASEELPEKFAQPVNQMSLQAVRMQMIVNDLLYLAKLEDSENADAHLPVDVTHIVNTIMEALQPLIDEKRHKLELDIDSTLQVSGAQTELHSAFANLVTNAICYTPEGGLLQVRWQATADGPEFSVKDNGYGIAAQHLDRLTQRFYRADSDRSREGGGTGLGLAIVKHVLQRHNAELKIESTEGKGSVFRCLFRSQAKAMSKLESDVGTRSA